MTREQVHLSITKTPIHYRDLSPGPLASFLPQPTRAAGRRTCYLVDFANILLSTSRPSNQGMADVYYKGKRR
jgi:hypothetical protein